jgi:uncharacterized iron-regulated membrane protein
LLTGLIYCHGEEAHCLQQQQIDASAAQAGDSRGELVDYKATRLPGELKWAAIFGQS